MKYIDLPIRLTDRRQWRGNAMILVAAMLTLLVIMATAYISRTRATRSTAAAHQSAAQREGAGEHVGAMLAEELAQALFARPLDVPEGGFSFDADAENYVGNSNNARIQSGAQLVGDGTGFPQPGVVGPDDRGGRYSADRWHPFNHAPMHVAPVTNLPDDNGVIFPPVGPRNAIGNPGFGDSRWLRSTEPLRWASNWQTTGQTSEDLNAFSHWKHMTYLARPDNGWRLCTDISNVGPQTTLMNLNLPVEQWLPIPPQGGLSGEGYTLYNSTSGNATLNTTPDPNNPEQTLFDAAWDNWFSGNTVAINPQSGALGYANPTLAPPNHYDLSDLDGDGNNYNFRDRPEAAYAKFDTAGNINWRWYVERRLNDTDGDGFTDSFWWIPPLPIKDGVHHVVGVSVVDLSGKLNLNTATIFRRNEDSRYQNDAGFVLPQATAGHTPADVALVGQEVPPLIHNGGGGFPQQGGGNISQEEITSSTGSFNWNTGFFDTPMNQPGWFQRQPGDDAERWVEYSGGGNGHQVIWPHLEWYANTNGVPTDGMPRWRLFGNYTDDPFLELFGLNGNLDFWDEAYDDPQNSEIHPWATQQGRLRYWNLKGSRPDDPLAGLTNLDLSEELELAAYHGQNRPYQFSELENYTHWEGPSWAQIGPLRGRNNRAETSEAFGQLTNQQLVFDNRRKLTGYNGARNDELPAWLRFSKRRPNIFTPDQWDYPAAIEGASDFRRVMNEFDDQRGWKLDLREDRFPNGESRPRLDNDPATGYLSLSQRLAPTLMMALTDGPEMTFGAGAFGDDLDSAAPYHSYFGAYNNVTDEAYRNTRRLAAAYAANILQWRDSDQDLKLVEAVPLPDVGLHQPELYAGGSQPVDTNQMQMNNRYFLGVEPQPFLLEAFVAHVHSAQEIPERDELGIPYRDEDQEANTVFENPYGPCANGTGGAATPQSTPGPNAPNWQSTIVVVQIANPFDVAIDLSDYVIDVFGQEFEIADLVGTPTADTTQQPAFLAEQLLLPPGTPEAPYTAVFYAMDENISRIVQQGASAEISEQDPLEQPWVDFLDLKVKPIWTNAVQAPTAGSPVVDLPSYDYDDPNSTPTLQPLGPQGQMQGSLVVNVNRVHEAIGLSPAWRTYRCWYDDELDNVASPTIQLKRYVAPIPVQQDVPGSGGQQQAPLVVVDRLDDPSWSYTGGNTLSYDFDETFAGAIHEMGEDIGQIMQDAPTLPMDSYLNPNQTPSPYEPSGLTLDQKSDADRFTHWTQWVRASRSWGYDRDGNGTYDPDERNPRYVFADRVITKPAQVTVDVPDASGAPVAYSDLSFFDGESGIPNQSQTGNDAAGDPLSGLKGGQRFNMTEAPDDANFENGLTNPREAWFLRDYWPAGAGVDFNGAQSLSARKPTFFNFAIEQTPVSDFDPEDAITWSIPDKGWYGQAQASSGGTGEPPEFSQEATVEDLESDEIEIELTGNFDRSASRYWYPMQMLQKDWNFEQVGELNNVWLFGHEIAMRNGTDYATTLTTFSEFMSREEEDLTGADAQVNRLRVKPTFSGTPADDISPAPAYNWGANAGTIGGASNVLDPTDPRWQQPVVPMGSRVFDAFVCDGLGEVYDINNDFKVDQIDRREMADFRFSNANGFTGKSTPGLVNVNTATVEVLRALPNMFKAVHMDHAGTLDGGDNPLDLNPRVGVPEAIIHYRDLLGGANIVDIGSGPEIGTDETGYRNGPWYHTRGTRWRSPAGIGGTEPLVDNMRDEPGITSIGELLLLDRPGASPFGGSHDFDGFAFNYSADASWTPVDRYLSSDGYRIGFAALDPFRVNDTQLGGGFNDTDGDGLPDTEEGPMSVLAGLPSYNQGSLGAYLSTDRQTTHDPYANGSASGQEQYLGDRVSSDSEEANLLFSGISNLITTRSDLFLVYFNVRGFKETRYPDGTIGWDATNKDAIVDESRWVMIVDRSEVESPSDEPRILLLERVDN